MSKISYSILLLLFFQVNIYAQIKDTIKLQEVTITDSLKKTSNFIIIDKTGALKKSTSELIESEPGITIIKRSVFSEEPVINSFKYDQINVIKNDGAKASSSCPNRMDPATTRITPNEISKIEIVKGPYELRYGQIMGGLVRFISNEKPDYEKFTLNGNLGGEYQSNGNGMATVLNINGGSKLFDFKTFANYRKFENYKSGNGTEISSSFETYAFGLTGGLNISEKQRITANYTFSRANDVMHAGLPMDAKNDISNMLALDYNYSNISPLIEYLKIKIFGSSEDHIMTNENRPNSSITLTDVPVTSENYGGRLESKLNLSKSFNLFIGADYNNIRKDGVKKVTVFKNICTNPVTVFSTPKKLEFSVWQNSYIQDIGVFTQAKYFFNKNLVLNAGLRTDFIKSNILAPEDDFIKLYSSNIKPKDELNVDYFGKFNYHLPKNFGIELAFGRGTRNASLLERYINHFAIGLDSYEYVGNPNLKSEINHQFDISFSKKNKVFYAYVNVFYSKVNNYITAEVDTNINKKFMACKAPFNAKRFVNIDEVEQYGISFGSKISMTKNIYTKLSASYVYAQNIDFNEPLSETPPFNAFFTIGYKTNNLNVECANEYQAAQNRVATSVGEKVSPSFYLLNIKASYKIIKNLNIGVAMNNILDKNYYQHLSRPYKKKTVLY